MDKIVKDLREFINQNWDRKSPLLLGYSGGPDSKALLYTLLELGLRPHLAHVDHGWREESQAEMEGLRREAESLGLTFHTTRLTPDRREWVAREQRLSFFASLFEAIPFQALLLAHQADDLAETALKRVLEGAHLIHLGGMKKVSRFRSMAVWRPILGISRRELIAWLEEKKLSPICDSTNFDPAYLRARMRLDILPELARSFGKEISNNLVVLSERAQELKEYLDRRTDEVMKRLQQGPWGLSLPSPEDPVEIRHALQRTGIPFTRTILEGLVEALARRLPKRKFGHQFTADRGVFLFSPPSNLSPPETSKKVLQESETI